MSGWRLGGGVAHQCRILESNPLISQEKFASEQG
jgi:hypothetical protein